MEREIIKYDLEYVNDDGSEGVFPIELKIVANAKRDRILSIIKEQNELKMMAAKYPEYMKEIGTILVKVKSIDQNDETKNAQLAEYTKQIEEIREKVEALTARINSYDDNTFFKKRFEIIRDILTQNGVTDQTILSYKFWDENVRPEVLTEFLDIAYYKDIDKKKQVETELAQLIN